MRSAILGAAVCCAAWFLWTTTPAYKLATKVKPPAEGEVQAFGHLDLSGVHRLGIIAGTVHEDGCLFEGYAPPYAEEAPVLEPLDVVKEIATGLRARGLQVVEVQGKPLGTHEPGVTVAPHPPGVVLSHNETSTDRPCTKAPALHGGEDTEYWKVPYPPTPALARSMSHLPVEAVLVVQVQQADAAPYQDGTLLFGSVSPAHAKVELVAQLIAKDGSVPWCAEAGASGMLRHPGIHLLVAGSSGPPPQLWPVREAAVARLVALVR